MINFDSERSPLFEELIQQRLNRFFENASPDFLACVVLGIPMTYESKLEDGKYVITATTDRVVISRDGSGKISNVVPSRDTK